MAQRDWVAWHGPYDDEGSPLHRRLQIVQRHATAALDRAPDGPIRAISLCAGQGRDLTGALVGHPRRGDVVARLVELDERNAEVARAAARANRLDGIEVVAADASVSDAYEGAGPPTSCSCAASSATSATPISPGRSSSSRSFAPRTPP